MDYAHKQTDKMLEKTERRISREYKKAEKEVAKKLNEYLAAFKDKDKMWAKWVKDGTKTQEEWNNWRKGQMAMGQRWDNMRHSLAEDMHHTNEIAGSIVNGHIPEVYALNHNYGTYEIESGLGIDTSYTLYDRQSVERLMRDNPQMLPPPGKRVSQRIKDGLDVKWNEKVIQSSILQSILQGESIGQIATRLADAVGDSNRAAALRNARTMTTGAQNAGRIDSYKRAQDMGIKTKQQWVATLDGRTRHEHRMLDGETVEVGEPWKIYGDEIRFPGDPAAPGYLVYNCRCTVIAALEGFERDLSDLSIRNADNLNGMSYDEWKHEKETGRTQEPDNKLPYDSQETYDQYKAQTAEAWEEKKAEMQRELEEKTEALLDEKYGGNFFQQRVDIRADDTLSAEEKERRIEEVNEKRELFMEERRQMEKRYTDELKSIAKDYIIYDLDYEGFVKRVGDIPMRDGVSQINPNFTTFAFEYTNNCQRCAFATEMWFRGYDVEAMPCDQYGGLGAGAQIIYSFQDGERSGYGGGHDAVEAIASKVESWGNGGRGVIMTQPRSGSGHVFNVANVDGNVLFIDSQSNMVWGTDETPIEELYGGTIEYSIQTDLIRTDDTKIYNVPEGWVKNRGE